MTEKQKNRSPKRNIPLDPLSQRLLEMTFASFDEVMTWLSRIGIEINKRDDRDGGTVILWNPSLQIRTGFAASSDPTTRAVSLGFITAGIFWPHLYPNLLKAVDAEMKKHAVAQVTQSSEKQPEKTVSESDMKPEANQEEIELIPALIGPTFQQLYRSELELVH